MRSGSPGHPQQPHHHPLLTPIERIAMTHTPPDTRTCTRHINGGGYPDDTTVTIRDPRYLIGNDKTRMLEFQIRIATAETNIDRQHAAMDLAAWLILAFHDPSLDIPLPEAPLNIELAVLEEVATLLAPISDPGHITLS